MSRRQTVRRNTGRRNTGRRHGGHRDAGSAPLAADLVAVAALLLIVAAPVLGSSAGTVQSEPGAAPAAQAAGPATATARPTAERHPAALAAERAFFAAFNGGGRREAPLTPLMQAWAVDADDPRTNLLLGLDHLWIAAEGDHTDARVIEHLLLAEVFLARAQRLDPADERIPSWLVPVRLSLAGIEGDEAARTAARRELLAAYERDPAFHSFTVALLGIAAEPGSADFARGLQVLRELDATGCDEGDPTCENHPRWPHNVEGFLTFAADYELKAGDRGRAAALLAEVQAQPSYAAWPLASEVEDRVENLDLYATLYANADPGDDPPPLVNTHGCASCHLGAPSGAGGAGGAG